MAGSKAGTGTAGHSSQAPIITALVKRHAGDAAFYWAQHDASAHSPLVNLSQLAQIDRLLDAHLDGIGAAGAAGTEIARHELERWQGPGEYFVCAVHALRTDAPGEALRPLWPTLQAAPERHLRGLIAALAWEGAGSTARFIDHWRRADVDPILQVTAWRTATLLGLSSLARTVPDLAHALKAESSAVRAAACRAAGRLRACNVLLPCLDDPSREVRAEAAIALAGEGDSRRAASVLWRAVAELNSESQTFSGWPKSRALHRMTRWLRHLGLNAPLGHPGIGALLQWTKPLAR